MRLEGGPSNRPDRGNEHLRTEGPLQFAMRHNGYLPQQRSWQYNSQIIDTYASTDFYAQQISFFGPGREGDFFKSKPISAQVFEQAFKQQIVLDTVERYRSIDESLAGRIAYLMGGIVRHLTPTGTIATQADIERAADAVGFAARMIKHGGRRSGEAVASAIGMYIISKGQFKAGPEHREEDEQRFQRFEQDIASMAQAVTKDPIQLIRGVKDLGISQVARLRSFVSKGQNESLPDISEEMEKLQYFPTVGLEYHFFPEDTPITQSFLQRLALLNISQYQKGSFIQFSREDQGPFELRMNPSLFPVAIANWNLMRQLLPEMENAHFSITFNRPGHNFSWESALDTTLLTTLQAFGWLIFAGDFDSVPTNLGMSGSIGFGDIYLGQTIQMADDKYDFSGVWGGGKGKAGQLSLSVGYGDNFPTLARFISMALVEPDLLDQTVDLSQINSPDRAVALPAEITETVLTNFQDRIGKNERLRQAYNAGFDIEDKLAV